MFYLIFNSYMSHFWMKIQMNGKKFLQIPVSRKASIESQADTIRISFPSTLDHKLAKDMLCSVHILTHVCCGYIQRQAFNLRSPLGTVNLFSFFHSYCV